MKAVYKITSKRYNSLLYVGSSQKYKYRISAHISDLKKQKHHNINLQTHANLYGVDDLVFDVLEIIDVKDLLIKREQFYLDTLKPECNICLIAGDKTGYKASPETCRKIGEGQPKVKSKHRFGQKEKSERMKGTSHAKGYKHTDDARRRISINHRQIRPVFQYSLNGEFIKEWGCAKWAADELKINHNSIYFNLRGTAKTAFGFKWYYKKQE